MAQKVNVVVLSDLSGDEDASTVAFGLDGSSYEIDLTDDESQELREFLARYVGAARRVTGAQRGRQAPARAVPAGPDPKEVRAWAKTQKIKVPERGRIPKDVTDKFLAQSA